MRKELSFAIIVIALIFSIRSFAQQKGSTAIRCIYLESYIKDADKPQDRRQDEFYLDIHNSKSAFYSIYERTIYHSRDSLLKLGLSADEIMNRQRDMPRTHQYFEIGKNMPSNGTFVCYDKIVKQYYYEAPIPVLKWEMAAETKEILGYSCQKAITTLYGRKWIAWFTSQVPVSDGPWLLTGLPGLILEASDDENIFNFTAIGIKKINSDEVCLPDRKAIKCTRDEFLKYRSKYYEDMQFELQNITGRRLQILGADGKPVKNKKKNFNFFEKN